MRGFESAFISTAADWAWVQTQVPYDCPYPIDREGRYVLRELIAIGPRSWVYIAFDTKLSTPTFDARVVVKIGRDSSGREAEFSRQIEHPDVPAVLDRGVSPLGHAFIVLEWVEGEGLDKIPVPWERARAVRFVSRLGRVIESAHARGIVHCDIKPDNVRVGKGERPVLIDFDLAAPTDQSASEPSRGNLGFMSPEQFRGDVGSISPQADVYGLGGLLVYLLTGVPVNGPDPTAARANLASARTWVGEIGDHSLRGIVARAIAPATADRYRAVSGFVDDLERWENCLPIEWQSPSSGKRLTLWARRKPARAAVIFTCAAIATFGTAGAFAWQKAKAETEAESIRLAAKFEQEQLEAEAKREAESLRKVNERAQAEIRRLQEMGRTQIKMFMGSYFSSQPSGQGEQHLPMLNWLTMLSNYDLFPTGNKPLAIDERLVSLRAISERAIQHGQGDSVPQLLTRLSMAELEVRANQGARALEQLASIREDWQFRLSPTDPLHVIIDSLELAARSQSGGAVSREQVEALNQTLREVDAPLTYRKLLDSVGTSQ